MTQEEVLERVKFHAELRGLSRHTVEEYCIKAKLFQNHYGKPATELDVTDIQTYLHYLRFERKLSAGSINTYNSGLRFLYNVALDRPLNLHKVPRLRKVRGFPDILSREEVTPFLDYSTIKTMDLSHGLTPCQSDAHQCYPSGVEPPRMLLYIST